MELFGRPIQYNTQERTSRTRTFSGPGTQIIAAQRLGRSCFAMEQEPAYVQVAMERWTKFTAEMARGASVVILTLNYSLRRRKHLTSRPTSPTVTAGIPLRSHKVGVPPCVVGRLCPGRTSR